MLTIEGDAWKRGGMNLLWGAAALGMIARPAEVASIRGLFSLARAWPATLPSNAGLSLVVAGVEGCLDSLTPEDAQEWIENDLRPVLLSFQEEYEGQCGLVLWLPTGRRRISMNRANENYLWKCSAPFSGREIAIGRFLWGGAESDARRIIDGAAANQDPDGPSWIGLHHARLS